MFKFSLVSCEAHSCNGLLKAQGWFSSPFSVCLIVSTCFRYIFSFVFHWCQHLLSLTICFNFSLILYCCLWKEATSIASIFFQNLDVYILFWFSYKKKKIRGISNTLVRKVPHDLYIQDKGTIFGKRRFWKISFNYFNKTATIVYLVFFQKTFFLLFPPKNWENNEMALPDLEKIYPVPLEFSWIVASAANLYCNEFVLTAQIHEKFSFIPFATLMIFYIRPFWQIGCTWCPSSTSLSAFPKFQLLILS